MNAAKVTKWTTVIGLIFFLSWWIMQVCYFVPEKLLYFNSADSTENILNSYYISNGWIAFRDFANNHFPGVYLLVGWMFKLMGVHTIDPSLKLAFKSHFYASYVVTLWQLIWFSAFFTYIFRVRLLAACMAAGLLVYLNFELKALHVLSETMLFPIFSLVPALLHRALWHPDGNRRLLSGLFLIFPWTCISIWLGLTAALSTAVIAFGASLSILISIKPLSAAMRNEKKRILLWSIGLVILAVVTLISIDLKKMFYFNFPFNKPLAPPNGFSSVWSHAAQHFQFEWEGKEWPLRTMVATVVLILVNLGLTAWVSCDHRRKSLMKMVLWASTLAVSAIFTIWRFPFGYKTVALLGINIGLAGQFLILLRLKFNYTYPFQYLANLLMKWRFSNFASIIVSFFFIYLASSVRSQTLAVLKTSIQPLFISMRDYLENHRQFREAGVCRFRSQLSSGCTCIRATNFNAGDFLAYDMRQCQTWGIWIVLIPYDNWSSMMFERDFDRKDVGFLLTDDTTHRIFGVSETAVSKIRTGRRCRTFNSVEEVCL
jgi:hypothetical protein